MIEPDYIEKSAIFDDSRVYRYHLVRRWMPGQIALWLMCNPSSADDIKLDPTLYRCLEFTRSWILSRSDGMIRVELKPIVPSQSIEAFGAFEVCNLYAFRSSDPEDLWKQRDPVGPGNDAAILVAAKRADIVISAWGNDPKPDRARQVAQMLADNGVQPYALDTTSSGSPKHPLARGKSRIPYTAVPKPWHAKGLR